MTPPPNENPAPRDADPLVWSPPPVLFTLGDWRVRATAILRRGHRRRSQQCLLFPPPGFTGQARISVIAGERREEYTGSWEGGRDPALATELHAQLGRWVAVLLQETGVRSRRLLLAGDEPGAAGAESGGPPGTGAGESPLVFSVPFEDQRSGELIPADLLIEPAPESDDSETITPLSLPIEFARAGAGGVLYLAPIVTAPAVEDGERGRRLADALLELEHDSSLRLTLSEDALPAALSESLAAKVRERVAGGRLDVLLTGAAPPGGSSADSPPFPHSVGRFALGADEESIAALRARGPRHFLIDAPDPQTLHAMPGVPELGATGHFMMGAGAVSGHLLGTRVGIDPLSGAPPFWPTVLFHMLMRESLRIAAPGVGARPRMRWLNFCPLFLERRRQWQGLGGRVARWNREHLSPRLVLCTPADYFAVVAELEDRRLIQPLPRR